MSMEDHVNVIASSSSAGDSARPKIQRYPLRSSAVKSNPYNPRASSHFSNSAVASNRVRPTPSSVSKSMSVLDLSGKQKAYSATNSKQPRRLSSIPAKASATPTPTPGGPKVTSNNNNNITPISENRTRISQTTPSNSDISRLSSRKKFNALSSASFWLSQIKVSESAAKHSISLGFFKLALEAGCEPQHFKRMQDELKSYVQRHQLAEFGEPVKELLERYNISENTENLQVSESVSQVQEDATKSSDEEENLRPKCLNVDSSSTLSPQTQPTKNKKDNVQKGNPGSRVRASLSKNSANSRSGLDSGNHRRSSVKKPEKLSKQVPNKDKGKIIKQGKKSSDAEQGPVSPSIAEDKQGNKENMDARPTEETSLTESVF